MVEPAADGSTIPRDKTIEYLSSKTYQEMTDNKLALCGFTHKDRVVSPTYKTIVGPDDQVLINENYVGYIEKIFVGELDDPYSYAIVQIFDPEDFAGKVGESITNFLGLMKVGVKLPSSVVIQAVWSPSNRAERIIKIKGMDFTQNPSFKGSGTVRTMSVVSSDQSADDIEATKSFSNTLGDGNVVATRTYSMGMLLVRSIDEPLSGSISPKSDCNCCNDNCLLCNSGMFKGLAPEHVISRSELATLFGLGNPIYKKLVIQGNVSLGSLRNLLKGGSITDMIPKIVSKVSSKMGLPSAFGNDEDDEGSISSPKVIRIIRLTGLPRPSVDKFISDNGNSVDDILNNNHHEGFTKSRLIDLLLDKTSDDEVRSFSSISNIQLKMNYLEYPKQDLIRKIIRNYKFYYDVNKEKMNEKSMINFKTLVVSDIQWLISLVKSNIYDNQSLSNIFSLTSLGKDISDSANKLSRIYRKLMITEECLGFIPQLIYQDWRVKFNAFSDSILRYITEDESTSSDKSDITNEIGGDHGE